ncbi:hypothetical protein X742_16445 [Mesorhizobium sp. LNHC232B00]|nr:hypothetical protein X742_16445 [Mesorhizobium sp. LNHC232B00]
MFRAAGYEKGGPEAAFRKAVLHFCRYRRAFSWRTLDGSAPIRNRRH